MQEAQKASSSDPENSTPSHVIFKLKKTKDKEIRGEKTLTWRGTRIRIIAEFFMQAGREWIEILSAEKKTRIQYVPNLTFKSEGDIMVLSDK